MREYCSPGMHAWAELLGLKSGIDYRTDRIDARELLELIEQKMKAAPCEAVARMRRLPRSEYYGLSEDLAARVSAITGQVNVAQLMQMGYVPGAVVRLGEVDYELVKLSGHGNSQLRSLRSGLPRMVRRHTLLSATIVRNEVLAEAAQ